MFNNWLKSKYSNNDLERENRNNCNNWRVHCLSYFTNNYSQCNIFEIPWYLGFHNYIYCFLLGATSKFFRRYKKHSKDIVKILKNGYCDESILGSINDFAIVYPYEPEIEDIGNAKLHLEKDYPDIWKLKENAKCDAKKYLENIDDIINEFQADFYKRIEQADFKEYYGNDEDSSFVCLHPEIILEIFREIRNKDEKRKLTFQINGNNPKILFSVHFENTETRTLVSIITCSTEFDKFWKKFNEIIQLLVEDKELKKLVKEYDDEFDTFYSFDKRTTFFDTIDGLYREIVYDRKMMNRKVNCGEEGCTSRFMNLMAIFPR